MSKFFKYIFISVCFFAMVSCALEDISAPITEQQVGPIEFIVRPTSFTGYNVSTKSTRALSDTQLSEVERKVVTAYFLAFDNDGNRVMFETLNVTNNTIPSKNIRPDFGDSYVTVCFIANVPYSYVASLTHYDNLSDTPLPLTYATQSSTGFIGIPELKLDVKKTPDNAADDEVMQCFPMFGISEKVSLSNPGNENKVVIELKRLFAKVYLQLKMDLNDKPTDDQATPYFVINDYAIANLPKKVNIKDPRTRDEEGNVIAVESSWVKEVESSSFEEEIGVKLGAQAHTIYDEDDNVNSSDPFEIIFYVPEYVLLPNQTEVDKYKEEASEKQQQVKPSLFDPDKRAIHLIINGKFHTPNQEELLLKYKVYLGENSFDSFSLFRNCRYDNYMTIKGTGGTLGSDNRVEVKYDGFIVGFQRATMLDSHFEVRPIRLRFDESFLTDIEEGRLGDGTVRVEIFEIGADGNVTSNAPTWAALERLVTVPEGSTAYCKGTSSTAYPTKRRYFTTSLVSDLIASTGSNSKNAGSYIEFNTDVENLKEYENNYNINGSTIIWLYIDEYSATNQNQYSADPADVRKAQLKVSFTIDGSDEGVSKTYTFSQRPIYPIKSEAQDGGLSGVFTDYYYGIEFFEEYLHSFDTADPNNEGTDSEGNVGGSYDIGQTTQGLAWGLEGVTLSRNNKALFVSEAQPSLGAGTDSKAEDGFDDVKEILISYIDEIISTHVQTLPAFYDYYSSKDVSTGLISNVQTRDYDGYKMNVEIIHNLLNQDSSSDNILLNQFPLNEINPLSVIAYCYNKNKRDSNGNVVTVDGNTINTANLHWYAPSIEEIEEIMALAYDKEDEFSVFGSHFYWSCQPAYLRNMVQVKYDAHAIWRDTEFFSSKYNDRDVYLNVDASGPYFQDDSDRARATKRNVEGQSNVSSSVDGTAYQLSLNGSNDFGTIRNLTSVGFYGSLSLQMARTDPIWTPANPQPTPTGATLTYHEGNDPRSQLNRVRCIYNPNPPTKATRTANNNGGYDYTYTN